MSDYQMLSDIYQMPPEPEEVEPLDEDALNERLRTVYDEEYHEEAGNDAV